METTGKSTSRGSKRWFWRALGTIFLIAFVPLSLLLGCQSKLIYFPRPYGHQTVRDWEAATSGKRIDYETSQGRQRAFLQGNLESPRHLWIVCGGNGTLALDWSEWLETNSPAEDAWLLVDFPGYGDCEGSPNPGRIREGMKTVVPLASQELGWGKAPDAEKLRFFGHSLGSAACLIAADEWKIQRGVLIAPFTSTMEMAEELTGVPLGVFVWHRFDNRSQLKDLAGRGAAKVIIVHGTDDEVIPVGMSRTLAAERKDIVELREIDGGRHNTIQAEHAEALAAALRETGGSPR